MQGYLIPIPAKDINGVCNQPSIAGGLKAIPEQAPILQSYTGGPALFSRTGNEVPDGRVEPVQKNRSQNILALENLFDAVCNRVGLGEVLLFDLDKNAEYAVAIWKRGKSQGI